MMRAAYKKSLDSFGSNESVCGHPDIYEAGGIMNNYQNQHDDMKNSVDYGQIIWGNTVYVQWYLHCCDGSVYQGYYKQKRIRLGLLLTAYPFALVTVQPLF